MRDRARVIFFFFRANNLPPNNATQPHQGVHSDRNYWVRDGRTIDLHLTTQQGSKQWGWGACDTQAQVAEAGQRRVRVAQVDRAAALQRNRSEYVCSGRDHPYNGPEQSRRAAGSGRGVQAACK